MTIKSYMLLMLAVLVPTPPLFAGGRIISPSVARMARAGSAHTRPARTSPARVYGGAEKPSGNPYDSWNRGYGSSSYRSSYHGGSYGGGTYGGSSYGGGWESYPSAQSYSNSYPSEPYQEPMRQAVPTPDLTQDLDHAPAPAPMGVLPEEPGRELNPNDPIPWDNQQVSNFWARIKDETATVVLLDFYTEPCAPCVEVSKLIDGTLKAQYAGRVAFYKIRIDASPDASRSPGTFRNEPGYEKLLGVSLPSLVLLEKRQGTWTGARSWHGSFSADEFKNALKSSTALKLD